jgi:perosamine synthetase
MPPQPAPRPAAPPPALRYPYGRHTVDADDVAAVVAALGSGTLTCGVEVGLFERAIAEFLGVGHVTVCSSGTAALHLAYATLGIGAGDEIITSPVTFSATASAAYQVGAKVKFADVDPRTGNLDPGKVAALVTKKTKAIVAVHLGGQPCDLTELRAFARGKGLLFIEDACHALGALYGGRAVPDGDSDAAVLSFHPVKHVTTGEGGAVVWREREHRRRAARLRHHGVERDPAALSIASPGPWYYEVVEQGWNYRLPDLLCALGTSQVKKLPQFLAARRSIAADYRAALAALPMVTPPVELPDRVSAYHLFAIAVEFDRLDGGRGEVMRRLARRGIGTQVHYIPLTQQPFHRAQAGAAADRSRPGVERYYRRTLSLPIYPGLTTADVATIVAALADTLTELSR